VANTSFNPVGSGVPQLGTSALLDPDGSQISSAVWRNNSIWTANAVTLNGLVEVQWYQITTSNGYALFQEGTINPGNLAQTFFPSIAVDGFGDIGITYTQSGTNQYPAMMFAGRKATDPMGTMPAGVVVQASPTYYDPDTSQALQRWGDYSGLSVDPGRDLSFWAMGQYASATNKWATWVAGLTLPASLSTHVPRFDFTGIGRDDIAVFRPGSSATWFINPNTATQPAFPFPLGGAGDIPVPGDYDGDGITDYAVFTPSTSTFTIYGSTVGQYSVTYGGLGDIPVPGDYTGIGKTDVAVFRRNDPKFGGADSWNIDPTQGPGLKNTSGRGTGSYAVGFGAPTDIPVPGDYPTTPGGSGDGKTDIAVFRPGSPDTWFIDFGGYHVDFGGGGDTPVPADYSGDGTTDIATFVPGSTDTWLINPDGGSNQNYAVSYGQGGGTPVPADYNGNIKSALGVFTSSSAATWSIAPNQGPGGPGSGTYTVTFGGSTDIPISQPAYYLYQATVGQGGGGHAPARAPLRTRSFAQSSTAQSPAGTGNSAPLLFVALPPSEASPVVQPSKEHASRVAAHDVAVDLLMGLS
jgi:hypothetical protein